MKGSIALLGQNDKELFDAKSSSLSVRKSEISVSMPLFGGCIDLDEGFSLDLTVGGMPGEKIWAHEGKDLQYYPKIFYQFYYLIDLWERSAVSL